ncbi:MAG TPA: hypothetical protein DDZ51_30960 [Planctomycetaceae bacterium]|nr:hypothetical protein [Planctomycetaceae bacterium]
MSNASLIRFRLLLSLFAALSVVVSSVPAAADDVQQDGSWVIKEGRYVRLVTDLPDSPSLAQWVEAFDAAVPLWAHYWGRNPSEMNDWRVTAYLMVDKTKFVAAGTLPRTLPDFRFGYQAGDRIWVLHQPEDYYNRHLLLHEGAHAITAHLFGGGGPPWFMEGTAEWMSTHNWQPAAAQPTTPLPNVPPLAIGIVPASSAMAQGWGRIELIESARKQNRVLGIESVMKYGDSAHREVEPYAWSWLAATLLDMYPLYREVRREAGSSASDRSPQFNSNFYGKLRTQWPVLSARWHMLAHDIDYGWDPSRQAIELDTSLPPLGEKIAMKLDTSHSWQSAPISLMAGQSVQITADGRFTIRKPWRADEFDIDDLDALLLGGAASAVPASTATDGDQSRRDWYSEADGITIHYYRGQPIGKLVARLLPMKQSGSGPYLRPLEDVAIGRSGMITAKEDSWLLLKVNEPPSGYADNEGELVVELSPAN